MRSLTRQMVRASRLTGPDYDGLLKPQSGGSKLSGRADATGSPLDERRRFHSPFSFNDS
jgi:hypothetical protein